MTAIEIILLVLVVLAIVLHSIPKPANPLIAKAQQDVDDVYDWMLDHMHLHATPATTNASTSAPAITQTVHAPAAAPAPVPDAPSTFNGMLVPPGWTLGDFTQLGGAVQAAQAQLHPEFASYLMTGSQIWWGSLGRFYREALLHFATGDVLAALQAKANDPSAPKLETVSDNAWSAAQNAVTAPKA